MAKAALYVRVSTPDQHHENQIPELERLAKSRGWDVVATYAEKVSAAKTRPEFERLLKDAHRSKFDFIIVWSLDRLGRSMLGNLTTVLDLDRKGVRVVWERSSKSAAFRSRESGLGWAT